MATFEEMNPGMNKTYGHAEREALGLPPTEATPNHVQTAGVEAATSAPSSDSLITGDYPTNGEESEAIAKARYEELKAKGELPGQAAE